MGNLPVRTAEIIGRTASLGDVRHLLREQRLLTLLGPPGCGKTTLALECARQEEGAFPGGAWLIDLASVETSDVLLPTLAATLGVGSASDLLDAVVARLDAAPTLLVFDNCEHLIEEVARICAACLTESTSVVILATSRRALSVSGERLYDVDPLAVSGSPDDPDLKSPAVRLFVIRASDRRPSMSWSRDDLVAAWAICARLDGLPLAIELAAAACRVLSPQQLLAQLERGVSTFDSERRDVPRRHRSLDDSIAWSWELLTASSSDLLARLSVFPGDFSFDAAQAASAGTTEAVLTGLRELVDSSLLRVTQIGSEARYRLLDSIRGYAARRLESSGLTGETRGRALQWCIGFAESVSRESSADAVIGKLAAEVPNIRAALDHALAMGAVTSATRLAAASYRVWETRHVREGIALATRLLAALETSRERAGFLLFGARLAALAGDVELCAAWAAEGVAIGRSHGDPHETGAALRVLARATRWVGDPERALALFEEAIELLEGTGRSTELVDCYTGVADLSTWTGDPARATRASSAAVAIARADGDRVHLVRALVYFGVVEHAQGRLGSAERALTEAVQIADLLGEQVFSGIARGWLARMGTYRGAFEESLALAQAVTEDSSRSDLFFSRLSGEWAVAHLRFESGTNRIEIPMLEDMAATFGALQFPSFAAEMLCMAASVMRDRGELDAAEALISRAYEQVRLVHGRFSQGRVMLTDASLAAARNRKGQALNLVYEALSVMRKCGDRIGVLLGIEDAAGLVAERSPPMALQLFAAMSAERWRLGAVVPPIRSSLINSVVDAATGRIGQVAAEAARREGESLALDDAIVLLQRRRGRPRAAASGWESLSRSEVAVAREIAAGRTTAQIAARLSVAPTTVKTHVGHIFDKLGVRTRAAVAALTARHDPAE